MKPFNPRGPRPASTVLAWLRARAHLPASVALCSFVASVLAPGIAQGAAPQAPSEGRHVELEPRASAARVPPELAAKTDASAARSAKSPRDPAADIESERVTARPERLPALKSDSVAKPANETDGDEKEPAPKVDEAAEASGLQDPQVQRAELPGEAAQKSGASSQAIQVPKGTGTVEGLGESFSTQLSTGVATLSVPIALPPARGAAQPSLALSYSSASGSGVAGMGWDVGVSFIARQTDRGIPKYRDGDDFDPDQDRFVFNSGQELVPICTVEAGRCQGALPGEVMPPWSEGAQYFRPRVEGSFLRFFWSADHRTWRVQDKSGVTLELGVPLDGSGSTQALESNPDAPSEIYRWNLVRQYDTQGDANPSSPSLAHPVNVVVYRYLRDAEAGNATYLSDIYDTTPVGDPLTGDTAKFAHHTRLVYETRPDPATSYKSGWKIDRKRRLVRVDVTSKTFNDGSAGPRALLRRVHLRYAPDDRVSLLESVEVEGSCAYREDANGLLPEVTDCPRLPAMTFGYSPYTAFDGRVREIAESPPRPADGTISDLFDLNSDALPDLLVATPGLHTREQAVFFNGAGGRVDAFGTATAVGMQGVLGANLSTLLLSNQNLAPLDADGDGTIDLLHMPAVATYSIYTPRFGAEGWRWVGRAVTTADRLNPRIDLGRDAFNTRVVDVNFDGLVDVVRTTGTEVQTFFSLGRYPGGNGQFGQARRTGPDSAELSTEPVRTCVPWSGLPAQFSDREIYLADMNADGIQDIVRVQHGAVRYWPGRGNGFWGTGQRSSCPGGTFGQNRHVLMTKSPNFSDVQGTGLRLDDVDGDGFDDLVQVRYADVDIWVNDRGTGFLPKQTITNTPLSPAFADGVRVVDVNGSGTRDILWTRSGNYVYVDLLGGTRPWLLTEVKNGLGKVTSIDYTTSTAEMLAAERNGGACTGAPWSSPWCSRMPIVAHVVQRVTESDQLTVGGFGPSSHVTEYRYRDPVYDGRQREFRGFQLARSRRLGDANSPTDLTQTRFLLGECVDATADAVDDCEDPWRDNPEEPLKGLPLVTERYDEAGTYLSTEASGYRLRPLYTGRDGRDVRHAFQTRQRSIRYDTAAIPHAGNGTVSLPLVETEALVDWSFDPDEPRFQPAATARSFVVPLRSSSAAVIETEFRVDPFGNRFATLALGCVDGSACTPLAASDAAGLSPNEEIASFSFPDHPAGDETGWLFRTVRTFVQGSLSGHTQARHDTRIVYDTKGNPTRTEAQLSGTMALDRDSGRAPPSPVLPADPPRRSADGTILLAEQGYDSFGNLTSERGPNGRCRTIGYESALGALGYAQLPTVESIYTTRQATPCTGPALVSSASYDRGFAKPTSVVDATGQATRAVYDALGRLTHLRVPRPDGAVAADDDTPWSVQVRYTLATPARPYSFIETETQDAREIDDAEYLRTVSFIDGLGRTRLVRSEADKTRGFDAGSAIESGLVAFDAKGAVARQYIAYFSDAALTDPLPSRLPAPLPAGSAPPSHAAVRYDAFGRAIETSDFGGVITLRSVHHALSTDFWDAADLEQEGEHAGTFASMRTDGHGRTVAATERIRVGGAIERREVRTRYLPTGEPEVITRVRLGHDDDPVVRWMRYDSLGRLVLNVEPHTSQNFTSDPSVDATPRADGLKAWRYAYDDAGELAGTSDARGCGVNLDHDAAGRLVSEDYVPCEPFHPPYSAPDPSTLAGIEVFYQYDALPESLTGAFGVPSGYVADPSLLAGRLSAVVDRSSVSYLVYDARGRLSARHRRVARPDGEGLPLDARYAPRWFSTGAEYDTSDRVVEQSTGACTPELLANGASSVTTTYSDRGALIGVGSSYGDLISMIQRAADGLTETVVYADAAHTTAAQTYDSRRRIQTAQLTRSVPPLWSEPPGGYLPTPALPPAAPTSFQMILRDESYEYDVVGNPTAIVDARDPAEWPAGAKPVTRRMAYDDLYRLTRLSYEYGAGGPDTHVSPHQPELSSPSDPRRTRSIPAHLVPPTRPQEQVYAYDWLGSLTLADDDRHTFWDRGVGPIRNDIAGDSPYRFQSAGTAADPSFPGQGSAQATGYDESGNLLGVSVDRTSASCRSLAPGDCDLTFTYRYDELGRLIEAERLNGGPPARLRYAYDADDNRILKTDLLADPDPRHTVYVFDTLELRRTVFDPGSGDYVLTLETEVPYLQANGVRLGRIVHEGPTDGEPRRDANAQHVFLYMGDHLGSTSAVVDRATGELVERMTYQPYGATESDYRPERWRGFREDYRFTGKEEDVEVGLTYFGKRFLSPYLGRWITPDPLAVHALGADLNLYAYVSGRALRTTDPVGLAAQSEPIGVNLTESQAQQLGVKNPGDEFFLDPRDAAKKMEFANPAALRAEAAKRGLPVFSWDRESTRTIGDAKDLTEFATLFKNLGTCAGLECSGHGTRDADDFLDQIALGLAFLTGEEPGKNGVSGGAPGGKLLMASPDAKGNKLGQAMHIALSVVAAVVANRIATRAASNPKRGRFDTEHTGPRGYDEALAAGRRNAGDLGPDTKRMYDPETGTLIGERSADGTRGWRIDDDHVNFWDWTGGKKGMGGRYGHEFYPPSQAGPHSKHIGYALWE